MPTLVGEGIGAFIIVGYEHYLVGLEVFSFWEPPWSVIYGILSLWESLWIRWSVGSKPFHDTWVASKYLIHAVSLYQPFSASLVSSSNRQPTEGVSLSKKSAFWEPNKASHGQWRVDGSSADAEFPSARPISVTLCGHQSTLVLSLHQWLSNKKSIIAVEQGDSTMDGGTKTSGVEGRMLRWV